MCSSNDSVSDFLFICYSPGKKTAQAIQQEVAREVNRLLSVIFQDRRKAGRLDLEAVEASIRSAMHQAGAAALTQLLQYDPPDEDHRTIPCSCGYSAHYKELRSKTVLTVVGTVRLTRPYYLCAHCATGQYPVDVELGIAGLESSPGVRRMEAVVGSEMPFALGCEPMKVLAGLDVPAKAVERAAEAIGAQIAQQDEIPVPDFNRQNPQPASTKEILDALDEQSIDFLKRCPFALVGTTAADGTIEVSPKGDEPVTSNKDAEREEELHKQALDAVAELKVQSIMRGTKYSSCMINNTLYHEGQQIGVLKIEQIAPNTVIVSSGKYRFEVKMQK